MHDYKYTEQNDYHISHLYCKNSLFWNLKFLTAQNYALQFMTKTEKADNAIKDPIRAFQWSDARKIGVTILSHRAKNFVGHFLVFSKKC